MKSILTFGLALFLATSTSLLADVRLPGIISDHMVLQKGEHVPIWGWASPGESVQVSLGEQKVKTTATENGEWRVDLPLDDLPQGPHTLVVEGNNRVEVDDVVLGEVWLCSGQSNMAFILKHSIGFQREEKLPEDRKLRQFHVTGPIHEFPKEDIRGKWVIANAKSIPRFTAVGYFFGKRLSTELDEPVGLIIASVGGTAVEAWTSRDALAQIPELRVSAEKYHEQYYQIYPGQLERFANEWNQWIESYDRQVDTTQDPERFTNPGSNDWDPIELPGSIAPSGDAVAGVVWLRRTVQIEDPSASHWWVLELGDASGLCDIYWNGHKIRTADVEDISQQKYPLRGNIPNKWILEGDNQLVVCMYQPREGFSIGGELKRFRLSYGNTSQSLQGTWEVKTEVLLPPLSEKARNDFPKIPAQPQTAAKNLPSGWFNSKIAPIIPFGIRGVIWYQGESNAGRAYQYRESFPLMIQDWRTRWGLGEFPFYWAQLANYGQKSETPEESNWAELREAQTLALRLPNTGQAILTDLGESRDIHPRNKQDVGERLAMIALAKDYGRDISYSGPRYQDMKIEEDRIRLTFDDVDGGLVAQEIPDTYVVQSRTDSTASLVRNRPDSELEGFAICGPDREWYWADATIDGNSVIVQSPEVSQPVAVRYNWADNPSGNLYNQAGLPAHPFRTDDFPLTTEKAKY
ncbi:sialate O-acetylesterase [Puniceicoccus vermicola]|uniref:Acetyl esterase n=1 Tax=Puniceicoccus vermicola TaxID=388746 RepID=A0A7X1AZ45_9BACT|nr:sialate O-acetylesterase [Puniceicoccus vermicola]MBC2602609.1 acetyl esterase [Puniceicoccus vermicola]